MKKEITQFLAQTFKNASKQKAVIGVSGGIDSAVSLTLATQALGADNIIPVMLPYSDQDLSDGKLILDFNQIPQENWQVINIKSVVDAAAQTAGVEMSDKVRFGNLMARTRMMMLYDLAKKNNALVCGTENKSEKYLGYFTRFGDEASDLEPIAHLYKTQVRQLAETFNLPASVIAKSPSADLWAGQTDEQELGFSYEVADQVLAQLIDEKKPVAAIGIEGVEPELIQKVIQRVEQMKFKQQVPYSI
ncbi:MAG: NAD+ synthase [Candidatus Pacebacteria bacterium]|jgi:NAD+ synthase|nr:NAD+ synthase [Candidatus Paceibacterota bacterium]MBT3512020.1 NAD+ synthase [Candidatus Paceibacterota bacterium]MBT4004872.1 NAD+ synthase [Candidatus Paceibacterota bacterium]MBT4359051.1 NAD+ synthase [Candidatus Paceibacterota bacterium]MBT4680538.1 NAD+ synthase [Candidatus Paceibacterota bacterium]